MLRVQHAIDALKLLRACSSGVACCWVVLVSAAVMSSAGARHKGSPQPKHTQVALAALSSVQQLL
jgi:hypothetical protein